MLSRLTSKKRRGSLAVSGVAEKEENLHVSGPMQLKAVLFKSHQFSFTYHPSDQNYPDFPVFEETQGNYAKW